MNLPVISVIMLTYNREEFVGRMINCVLAQTFADFEFIIVDNGSTDRSGTIADEYAARDARIRVLHRERGNIGSGRNTGLDAARCEYITFVDDDDTLEPDYLEFLLGLAVESGADISICGAADKVPGEPCVMAVEDALVAMYWRRLYNNQFPTKLIRRSLFDGIRFSAVAKYDDIELMTYIMAKANKVAYNGAPKYDFNRHGGNNSAWTQHHELLDAETLGEYIGVYSKRTMWLLSHFPNRADTWKYFEWSFWISMVEKVTRLELRDCYALCEELVRALLMSREEFLSNELILDFEREWMSKYV